MNTDLEGAMRELEELVDAAGSTQRPRSTASGDLFDEVNSAGQHDRPLPDGLQLLELLVPVPARALLRARTPFGLAERLIGPGVPGPDHAPTTSRATRSIDYAGVAGRRALLGLYDARHPGQDRRRALRPDCSPTTRDPADDVAAADPPRQPLRPERDRGGPELPGRPVRLPARQAACARPAARQPGVRPLRTSPRRPAPRRSAAPTSSCARTADGSSGTRHEPRPTDKRRSRTSRSA